MVILKVLFGKKRRMKWEGGELERMQETRVLHLGSELKPGWPSLGLGVCIWAAMEQDCGFPRPLQLWSGTFVNPAPPLIAMGPGQVTPSLPASDTLSLKWEYTTCFAHLLQGGPEVWTRERTAWSCADPSSQQVPTGRRPSLPSCPRFCETQPVTLWSRAVGIPMGGDLRE